MICVPASLSQEGAMGFETFRVELRGGPAGYPEVDEAIRRIPHARPDPHSLPLEGSA